jgi:hypothetical protein
MQDFFQFYEYGGFFMNVISLMALAGLATLVAHGVGPRARAGETRLLDLADRLGGLTVAAGVLGSTSGGIELGWVLSTIDLADCTRAAAVGGAIALVPLCWALVCGMPLWLASACFRMRVAAVAR